MAKKNIMTKSDKVALSLVFLVIVIGLTLAVRSKVKTNLELSIERYQEAVELCGENNIEPYVSNIDSTVKFFSCDDFSKVK